MDINCQVTILKSWESTLYTIKTLQQMLHHKRKGKDFQLSEVGEKWYNLGPK